MNEDLCDKKKDDADAANPVKAQVFEHLLYRHWNSYVGPKRNHVLVVSAYGWDCGARPDAAAGYWRCGGAAVYVGWDRWGMRGLPGRRRLLM